MSLLGYHNHFYVFLSLGFIYLFFNLLNFYPVTRFFVSPLVVTRYCVTLFKNTEEERKLIENGTPESTIRLKKYSSKKFFWNGLMVGNKNLVLEPCVYTTGKSLVHRLLLPL